MSTAWEEEIPRTPEGRRGSGGSHTAYFFADSAEKQRKLFQFVSEQLGDSSFVLYIAGKQGTKGIRLSMKDARIDVAAFERAKKLRIADSEEWYLTSGRTSDFKSDEEISSQFRAVRKESEDAGNERLIVISETDQLVRKGFLSEYMDFERTIAASLVSGESNISFLCAYDERELGAAKVPRDSIVSLHSETIVN